MLALTGKFWQEDSYEHMVPHEGEFEKTRNYIEENPVRAASQYRWSSADLGDQGVARGRGRPPHQSLVGQGSDPRRDGNGALARNTRPYL